MQLLVHNQDSLMTQYGTIDGWMEQVPSIEEFVPRVIDAIKVLQEEE